MCLALCYSFIEVISFNPHNNFMRRYSYPYFTDMDTDLEQDVAVARPNPRQSSYSVKGRSALTQPSSSFI